MEFLQDVYGNFVGISNEFEMNFHEILPPATYKMIRISIEISRKYELTYFHRISMEWVSISFVVCDVSHHSSRCPFFVLSNVCFSFQTFEWRLLTECIVNISTFAQLFVSRSWWYTGSQTFAVQYKWLFRKCIHYTQRFLASYSLAVSVHFQNDDRTHSGFLWHD